MSLVTIPGGIWLPRPSWGTANAPSFATITMDAAPDRFVGIFKPMRTGNIDRVLFHIASIATNAALDVRIETVSTANAFHTGSLWGTNTSGQVATPAVGANECALTAVAAVDAALDTLFAVVIQPNTTPISLVFNTLNSTAYGNGASYPYNVTNTTGSNSSGINPLCMAVRYDDGVWEYNPVHVPVLDLIASAFDDGTDTAATTGSRRGLRFSVPTRMVLRGCFIKSTSSGSATDREIRLYDADGNQIGAPLAVQDGAQQASSANIGQFVMFNREVTLSPNTFYTLAVCPTTTNNYTQYEFTVADAAYMDCFEGGQNFHLAKFVSGAWVYVTTERPWIALFFSQIDDGASGGLFGARRRRMAPLLVR
jgi:hypothetical protein